MEGFHKKKVQIKKDLLSKSLVHLSFDMWTSPSSMGMIAVVVHHISRFGEVRDCLLALKRVTGAHSGENMAHLLILVIKYYELHDQLGYFVLNNISSNDTRVREVLRQLRPDLNSKSVVLATFLISPQRPSFSGKNPRYLRGTVTLYQGKKRRTSTTGES
jgi:hypothetical protein